MKSLVLFSIAIALPLSTGQYYKKPARKCYTSKATCVPIEFCPKIFEALHRHSKSRYHHRQPERPAEVTCRECKQYEGQLSVFCEPGHSTALKDCVTVTHRDVSGQCIPEEYCHRPLAKVHRKSSGHGKGEQSIRKTCFEEDTKNYYCCPRELHSRKPIPDGSVENVHSRCRDSRRRLGRCVPVGRCDFLNQIRNIGTKESFIRLNLCKSDALTGQGRSICCADAPAQTGNGQPNWIEHPKAARLGLQTCGSVAMEDNIFRGSKAAIGQYPWMVNLLYLKRGQYHLKGAGTLIHPRYVLTAAHAVIGNLKKVRLGEYDLASTLDCDDGVCAQPAIDYPIHKRMIHELFRKTSDYDIALLELYRDVNLFPQQIYPICLPLTKSLLMLQPRQMTVTGWGWSDRNTSVLLEADMHVVDRVKRNCPGEPTFCARGKNWSGHCRGDSGGPYQTIVPVEQAGLRYVQFGIISAGSGQCTGTKLAPGVGVSVAYHIRWILDHMNI